MRARASLAAALLVAALGGCHPGRTEMVVRVTANGLAIPADTDSLRLIVTDRGEVAWSLPQTPFCPEGQKPAQSPPECLTLPLVATLFPGPKQPHDPVQVEVIAYAGADPVIDDAATFTFADGVSQLLDFVLYARCLHTDCAHQPGQPQSCATDGSCSVIAPQPLSSDPPLDAAPAPADAGVSDAAPGADGGRQPIAPVQVGPVTRGSSGTLTLTLPSSTAGNLLVATFYSCSPTIATAGGWTLTSGGVFCGMVTDGNGTAQPCYAHIAYRNAAGGSATLITNAASGTPSAGLLSEWSGADPTSPLDSMGQSTSNNSTSVRVSTNTTSFDGELGIGMFCQIPTGPASLMPAAGWSRIGSDLSQTVIFDANFELMLPGQTSISATETSTQSGTWGGAIVTFH